MNIRDLSGDNIFITRLELNKACGTHSHCKVEARVNEELARDFLARAGQSFLVTLSAEEKMPVFCGFIASVTKKTGFAGTSLEVLALSESDKLDRECKKRIFQNPDIRYGEIAKSVMPEGTRLTMADKFKSAQCQAPIWQDESDFAFLGRLARQAGTRVWVDDCNENTPSLRIADNPDIPATNLIQEKILSLEEIARADGGARIRLTSKQYLECGQRVKTRGKVYLIMNLKSDLYHGADIFHYELLAEEIPLPKDPGQKDVKLRARVTDNQDPEHMGRIRVHFQDVEDKCQDGERLWIPFRPPYGGKNGGMVFLPDKDDEVEVFLTGTGPFVATTLRKASLAEECRDVNEKYIGNNSGQRIFWRQNALEIFSGDNRITLNDKEIELTVGENIVKIGGDGILLQTPQSSIMMRDSGIRLESRGNVEAMGGGNVRLQSDSQTSLKSGAGVAIEASSGIGLKGSELKVAASGPVMIKGSGIDLG